MSMSRPGFRRLFLLVIVTVIGSLAQPKDAVAAKRRPCAKYCRTPIKECRASCTGTKPEKVGCRRACKYVYIRICHEYDGPSCTPPVTACGAVPLTCTIIALNFADWRPNESGGLPNDFPNPPSGAKLCGGVQRNGDMAHVALAAYLDAGDPTTVIAHYTAALTTAGYTVTEDPSVLDASRTTCDRAFRITRDATTIGGLYYLAAQGAYLVLAGESIVPPPKL